MSFPAGEKCSFAWPGTFGHECGAPAVALAVKKTRMTHTGLCYLGRCEACKAIKGGENAGVLRFEAPNGQVNDWNGRYSED